MHTLQTLVTRMEVLDGQEGLRLAGPYQTTRYSYRQILAGVSWFARWLDDHGFSPGDCVALWGPNDRVWLSVFWGCVSRRVMVAPVDAAWSPETAAKLAKAAGARAIVAQSPVPTDLPVLEWRDAGVASHEASGALPARPEDPVEIVFTSGTTGDPSGVIHRHSNLCSVLTPIEQEMRKFQRWARPFQPIRTLNLLPLSHLFGQAVGLFVPIIVGGAVVFTPEQAPGVLIRLIRKERVSVLAAVPQMLKNLRLEVERRFPESGLDTNRRGLWGAVVRWWMHRKIHRGFGWKFWAIVAGGASLPVEEEAFWRRLGFLVVQGYGMTETSPLITLNHPLNTRLGSVGKPMPGVQVRIADDGEILVRGPNVAQDYLTPNQDRFDGGWLRTGDLGEKDAEGRLYIKGRKKDVIVTANGMNVYPEEVEPVLEADPDVRSAAVVAGPASGGESVRAVIVPAREQADAAAIRDRVNLRLPDFQRLRAVTVWPEEDLPRTASTGKVRRAEVGRWLRGEGSEGSALPARPDEEGPEEPLASLDRVSLLAELEQKYGVEVDEREVENAATASEIERIVASRSSGAGAGRRQEDLNTLPHWVRSRPARLLRRAFLSAVVFPALRFWVQLETEGLDHLRDLSAPMIFTPNHTSLLDTAVLMMALPPRWRWNLAPAMGENHFSAYLSQTGPWSKRLKGFAEYWAAMAFFQSYPLPQSAGGARRGLRYTGEVTVEGFSPVVYPEGRYTPDGQLQDFQPGIAMMAATLGLPVVPVAIHGMYQVHSKHDRGLNRGRILVRFGESLRPGSAEDPRQFTERLRGVISSMLE